MEIELTWLSSLDGISSPSTAISRAQKKWDLDFHNLAWGPELEKLSEEFGDKAASLVFGRVTYEGMADVLEDALSQAR
jgi:hypothetical protein